MFEIQNTKKYRIKRKRLLQSRGCKKIPFIGPKSILLKVEENTVLTREQFLRLNQIINKAIKRRGKIKLPSVHLVPRTEKSVGVRMGKGKGSISKWVIPLKRGSILFEVEGFHDKLNNILLKELNYRLPCSICLISADL